MTLLPKPNLTDKMAGSFCKAFSITAKEPDTAKRIPPDSEASQANAQSAADIVGRLTTARHLAIQEQSAPSLARTVPSTRDIVNVISPVKLSLMLCRKRLALKLHAFSKASNIGVPRSLSPGIKALTDQAVPHHSHDHADSAAAALDSISVMRKKRISKQAAHPAAIPTAVKLGQANQMSTRRDCCLTLLQQLLVTHCWMQPCTSTKATRTAV